MNRFIHAISLLLISLILSMYVAPLNGFAQDDEEKSGKSGKLGRLGEDLKGEDEEDEGDAVSVWTFLDVVDVVDALAHMQPGPYPYNPITHSLLPDSLLPGGMVQLQASYFQNSADLYGFHWRYAYEKSRLFFNADVFNLLEQVDDEWNQVDLVSMHVGWDFYYRGDFILGGQIGFRSLYFPESVTGPEIGMKLVALPGRPVLLEMDGTLALINEKAFSTFSATLGLTIWRFEMLFGGQFFKSPNVAIDGWKLGIRFWL